MDNLLSGWLGHESSDIEEAEQPSKDLSLLHDGPIERRLRLGALHEAGHAVVLWWFSHCNVASPPFQDITLSYEGGLADGSTPPIESRLIDPQKAMPAAFLAGLYAQERYWERKTVTIEQWRHHVAWAEAEPSYIVDMRNFGLRYPGNSKRNAAIDAALTELLRIPTSWWLVAERLSEPIREGHGMQAKDAATFLTKEIAAIPSP